MANNRLHGSLSDEIASLQALTLLDLHGNTLKSLPHGLGACTKLRSLNVAENQLSSLPWLAVQHLPLVELLASKNSLNGVLIPAEVEELGSLQILDVSQNAIVSLTASSSLSLPNIQQVLVSGNRLKALPGLARWTSLLILAAQGNDISTLPDGFTALTRIRNADFTGNALKVVDEHVGLMDSLEVLRLASNPLRERRFLSMSTPDLKLELHTRLAPASEDKTQESRNAMGDSLSVSDGPVPHTTSTAWPIKSGGLLDCSSSALDDDLLARHLESILTSHAVRAVDLNRNLLTTIPNSLSLSTSLSSLNLSHNALGGAGAGAGTRMLTAPLDLPRLQTLNLSSNALPSLEPLLSHLSAPALSSLDISCNRIASLPHSLRVSHFPSLTILLAGDNAISGDLTIELVSGLVELDVQNNNIDSLDPRLGLLKASGLQKLEVRGNRFRVPGWRVLEKGTGPLLEWLKGRMPEEELEQAENAGL